MLPTRTQTDHVFQSDIMAIDALFKRIAERGRRIRNRNKVGNTGDVLKETPLKDQDSNAQTTQPENR